MADKKLIDEVGKYIDESCNRSNRKSADLFTEFQ